MKVRAGFAELPGPLAGRGWRLALAAGLLQGSALSAAHAEPPSLAPHPSEMTSPTVPAQPAISSAPTAGDSAAMARFLDRLMLAESGGRDDARNPRSTALGPFQFIEATFLEVVRRHLAEETAGLTPVQILAKRTDRTFSRRAAEAFTRDNAAALAAAGLETSYANLRLAFLAGAGGAIRVLKAEPGTLAITALGVQVVQANPFMAGMTTGDLAVWSARNLSASDLAGARVAANPAATTEPLAAAGGPKPQKPAIAVRCSRGLASCRRWVALATHRVQKGRVVARKASRSVRR